jgi:hypothetical protein
VAGGAGGGGCASPAAAGPHWIHELFDANEHTQRHTDSERCESRALGWNLEDRNGLLYLCFLVVLIEFRPFRGPKLLSGIYTEFCMISSILCNQL